MSQSQRRVNLTSLPFPFFSGASAPSRALALAVAACVATGSLAPVARAQDSAPPAGATGQVAPTPTPEPTPEVRAKVRERLARAFAQRARGLIQRDKVYIGMLNSAERLVKLAIAMEPDNRFIWYVALDLATTMEDGDASAAELQSMALRRLNELDPENELIRLRRIVDTVNKRQTAEERLAIYDQLTSPASIAQIGSTVAARLAFDSAILRRRTGDLEGFARDLLRAVDLDPSYPEATEVAAGYFRMSAPNAVSDAEAMRTALIANPVRTPAALGLSELCLEHGAYRAAADILNVEAEILSVPGPDPVFDGVLTDLTVAFWGSGQTDKAFAMLAKRQRMLDATLLERLDASGAILSNEERSKVSMPIAPSLAATFAALSNALGAGDAKVAIENAVVAYDVQTSAIDRMMKDSTASESDPAALQERHAASALEGAMVQLWLGGSVDQARKGIDLATERLPLSDDARARFDGWFLLREGKDAEAREKLTPNAARDPFCQVGLALLDEKAGDLKSAARRYLAVAQSKPSTALGLWAREKLWKILGKKVEIMPNAEAVEAAAALPREFLELMRDGSRKVLLRIRSREPVVRPWDPLVFDFELTNLSDWPLAVSVEGPIADSLTASAAVNIPGRMPVTPPLAVLAVDRKLVLQPKQPVRIPIDMSLTDASLALRDDPINGAFLSVHGILNWRTTERGLEPGPLGTEYSSEPVHVAGARMTPEWIKERLAELADPAKSPDPEILALLAHAHRRVVRDGVSADPAVRDALAGSGEKIADAARRLWPEARAWLAYAAPHAPVTEAPDPSEASATTIAEMEEQAARLPAPVPELEPLMKVLREDQDYLVRLAWISVRALRPDDPSLEETLTSADPRLAAFAKDYRASLLDVQEERRRDLNLR